MNRIIHIGICNKIAKAIPEEYYICGNNDFKVVFDFDDDWANIGLKTARFSYEGKYQDVMFEGNECEIPVILGTKYIDIGVFAGELCSSTPVRVRAKESIVDKGGMPEPPPENVYDRMMEKIDEKVDKVEGKGLSENDFTDTYKNAVDKFKNYTYIKNTDYASEDEPGIVQLSSTGAHGIFLGNDFKLRISPATENEIKAKTSVYKPIVPARLEHAVKMCTGQKGANVYNIKLPVSKEVIDAKFQAESDYMKDYVANELATFDFIKIVDELPAEGLANRLYLVPKKDAQTQDLFDEYVWVNGAWEWMTTKQVEIDLTGYVQKSAFTFDPETETLTIDM